MTALPLFDQHDIAALRHEREELVKRIRRGGMDHHSRIRTERGLFLVTADLMKLELQIGGRK